MKKLIFAALVSLCTLTGFVSVANADYFGDSKQTKDGI